MFGKPEWFVPKRIGWGLSPVTWQGWAYVGVWIVLIFGLYFPLFFSGFYVAAFTWLAACIAAMCFDTYQTLAAMKQPKPPHAE